MVQEIGNLKIHSVEENSFFIIQHNDHLKSVKIGKRELMYLLELLKVEIDWIEKTDSEDQFNVTEKDFMRAKFKQWGFLPSETHSDLNISVKNKLLNKLSNMRMIKLKSFNPDPFFSKHMNIINFILSPYMIGLNLLIFALSIYVLGLKGEALLRYSSKELLTSVNFFLLIPLQVMTIFIHELFHGISCKYYGGKSSEIGIMLFYFFPVMYCNTNDVYTFESRKSKAFVALAGLYSNIVLSGYSILLFFLLLENEILQMTFLVYGILNIGIVAFNLIPFVKFDGYWVLCSLINITNLMDKSFTLFLSLFLSFSNYKNVSIKASRKIGLTIFGGIAAFFDILFWAFSIKRFYGYLYPYLLGWTWIVLSFFIGLVLYSVILRWKKEVKSILVEKKKVLYLKF